MPEFNGYIGLTDRESISSYEEERMKLKNAPNIFYIVLDDVGFAQLGCYGSNINTPNIDRLAKNGLRYNNFHTTAICSATRASLLTGANHHTVGFRSVVDTVEPSYPNRVGFTDPHYANTAEVLRKFGYTNYAVGKWHQLPFTETTVAGPFNNWPLQRGFDRFYGFLEGYTDQFNPDLVQDNERIRAPRTAAEGYHLSEDLAEQAIKFVNRQHVGRPDDPFFLYLAFGAAHTPHQAPKEYIDKYKGKFDEGWDVIREKYFENQKKLGIIPQNAKLNPRNEFVEAWDLLSDEQKKVYARYMEVYAGFLEHTDAQIGKVLDHLEKIGVLDNTLVVLLSDNGASAEGGQNGRVNQERSFNLVEKNNNVADSIGILEELGSSEFTQPHYPVGWANAGNTPFQWYKSWVHSGGVKDPLIISYPNGIKARGEIRKQYIHVIDIAPTVLDILGVRKPEHINDVAQRDYHGISFKYTFDDPDAPNRRHVQYYEMNGHRGIWNDGWKAITNHLYDEGFDTEKWELYHVEEDYTESENVAEKYPEKLNHLINLWYAEAGKYGVFPMCEGRSYLVLPPEDMHELIQGNKFFLKEQHYEYKDIIQPVDIVYKTMFNRRNHKVTVELTHKKGNEGVLYSAGGRFGGYVLYIKDNRLRYTYNFHQEEYYKAVSKEELPEGELKLQLQFVLENENAVAKLYVNGKKVGDTEIRNFIKTHEPRTTLKDGTTTEVSDDFTLPFEYPAEIEKVVFDAAPLFIDEQEYLENFFEID